MFKKLNPTRKIMGRIFLWFWATFLVTAALAVVGTRFFFEELEVVDIKPQDVRSLSVSVRRIQRDKAQQVPLINLLKRLERERRWRLIAVNTSNQKIIGPSGPPIRDIDARAIVNLIGQESAIAIKRGPVKFTGPVFFNHSGERYALFSAKFDGAKENKPSLLLLFFIAILTTTILSWWFARSLTSPILDIQSSAKKLASGQWDTRVGSASNRHDELGELARDFNTMAARLQTMWGAQKRLLADVSHELRSPLARLQMALGLAYQQNVDPDTLSRVEREAERMEALVAQLLTLSRVEAGHASLTKQPLGEVLNDVFTDANFEAQNNNKQLCIAEVPQITVEVDSNMLCRAVENVIRNAIRHSKALTSVTFEHDETQWHITISDDGDGLSLEECEQIFSPFYRATLARERESGGVGLGLSIAKAAVELHNGVICAEPQSDTGLKVTLSFPR
ncbi:ATP-binding protein [Alteromonas sp. P256]|uniref:ATP-binding protein n=1 Tax=Alteromonas sp. P256 TaxID=3117399 RepID=UPI002FE304E6